MDEFVKEVAKFNSLEVLNLKVSYGSNNKDTSSKITSASITWQISSIGSCSAWKNWTCTWEKTFLRRSISIGLTSWERTSKSQSSNSQDKDSKVESWQSDDEPQFQNIKLISTSLVPLYQNDSALLTLTNTTYCITMKRFRILFEYNNSPKMSSM